MFINCKLLRHNCQQNGVEMNLKNITRSYCSFGLQSSKYIKNNLVRTTSYVEMKPFVLNVCTAHLVKLIRATNKFRIKKVMLFVCTDFPPQKDQFVPERFSTAKSYFQTAQL